MERTLMVLALCAAAGAAGAAQAKGRSAEAVLAGAPQGELRQVIDGRQWSCLGNGCRGAASAAAKSQPVVFECQGVAQKLGPLTLYRSGGRALSAEQLERCNSVARAPAPTATADSGAAARQ